MIDLTRLILFLFINQIYCGIIKSLNNRYENEKHYHPVLFDNYLKSSYTPIKEELETSYWINNAKSFVQEQLNKQVNTNVAKNVIFFIGDGMSIPTLAATRVFMGGEEKQLSFEKFSHSGMVKTYCIDKQVADSACTATAYLTGVKGNYGTIGVNGQVLRKDCAAELNNLTHTPSIAKWAIDAGKVAGLVTTTRVTHASPAGVFAHTANRDWENDKEILGDKCDPTILQDIGLQMVHGDVGSKLKVILGGGRKHFLDKSMKDEDNIKGARTDNRNLIDEWKNNNPKKKYVTNKNDLLSVDPNNTDFLLGLFESDHCLYHLEAVEKGLEDVKPSLAEMVDKAIDMLSTHKNGYFLFVEGGKIDMAHHSNKAKMALDETAQFSLAIELARNKTSETDTLLVVSSDHSHTMSISGYPKRGNNILGIAGISDVDYLPYMTLSYANGEGFNDHFINGKRVNPATLNFNDTNFRFPATVPLSSETHGGEDVGVFANGPWAHLFTGTYEQHALPHLMAFASCIGDGPKSCDL